MGDLNGDSLIQFQIMGSLELESKLQGLVKRFESPKIINYKLQAKVHVLFNRVSEVELENLALKQIV
jgi:hypothetical protein